MNIRKLTDYALKALKAKDKVYKINDGTIPGLQLPCRQLAKKFFASHTELTAKPRSLLHIRTFQL